MWCGSAAAPAWTGSYRVAWHHSSLQPCRVRAGFQHLFAAPQAACTRLPSFPSPLGSQDREEAGIPLAPSPRRQKPERTAQPPFLRCSSLLHSLESSCLHHRLAPTTYPLHTLAFHQGVRDAIAKSC